MNTQGPTFTDLAGPHRKPQVIAVTGTCAATNIATIVAAPGAGKRIVVLSFHMTAAGATAGAVSLKTATGGTIIWQGRAAANVAVIENPGAGQYVCACATNQLLEVNNGNDGILQFNVRYIIEAVV